jgi:hypothetical protein
MFKKHCSDTDLKNIHSVIVHRVSRKSVNACFSFCSCLLTAHAFTRIKKSKKTFVVFSGWISQQCVSIFQKRPMDCQFINAHNKPISEVFNFNTNIQIGDASQAFYSTLYTSKSTQDKDSKNQIRIGCTVIKRLKRVLTDNQEWEPSCGEGLSRVLSGLDAATTRKSSMLQLHISFHTIQ